MAIKDFGLRPYLRTSKDLPHGEDKPWKLICTIPYNCHFQPWIEVESASGGQILFNSSNPLVLYLTPTETCDAKPGVQRYEAKHWVSGEGAVYTIPAGMTVRAVQYRETGYDTSFAGAFVCNDSDYNTLWTKAARTAYICMRDHFYDCPDRERVGFWGDGTPELNQCFYVFDTKAHALAKELVLRKLEPKFYPGQHLEFLGDYGLWFYYLHTGDLESLRKIYEPTKIFLFETYQFGKRTWFDWGKEVKDIAVTETCFYYNCLGTLKKIALATGHDTDVPEIDQKRAAIQATFNRKFWKGSYYQSEQVNAPDDRANAMAVNVGLAERGKWDAIYENVLTKKTYASCFFDRWVFEALCLMGRQEYALLRMVERYKTMIPCTFTTLWEHYDRWWASRIDAFDDASSLNHGWNPPALILSQSITGAAPIEPGWTVFQVLPKEAFLTEINLVVPTVKGNVTVTIKKTKSEYALSVTAPANTTAVVGIPKAAFSALKAIKIGSKTLWENGSLRSVPAGVAFLGEDADYVKFSVPSGAWKFRGLGSLPLASPKPAPKPLSKAKPLEKKHWVASASVPDSSFLFSGDKIPIAVPASSAIDGDHWTGWRDVTRTQYPGQWFQLDLQRPARFSKIVLDNTWALWDSPVGYAVTVSPDGSHWSTPIATGKGELGITIITFPTQTARYVRITQTGTSPLYHWSIYEIDLL